VSAYRKGYSLENAVVHDLTERGYFCIRSAGSKGKVDVVAFPQVFSSVLMPAILFIQCRRAKRPVSVREWNALYLLALERGARAVIAFQPRFRIHTYQMICAERLPRSRFGYSIPIFTDQESENNG
jgi:Holliday junction resolvase